MIAYVNNEAAETTTSSHNWNFSISVIQPYPIKEIDTATSSRPPSRKFCAGICPKTSGNLSDIPDSPRPQTATGAATPCPLSCVQWRNLLPPDSLYP